MKLHPHQISSHSRVSNTQDLITLEFVTDRFLMWKIDADLPEDVPHYRTVYKCHCNGCSYLSLVSSSLVCHIRNSHQDIEALRHKIGLFRAVCVQYALYLFSKDSNPITLPSKKVHHGRNTPEAQTKCRYI
ncbi:hypothetical protein TRFO_30033 [Tritrichomonas foetus]|uniref:Uncharacterized protein n=1 Tax=Tritrichomonas foetus TaxID=1144522 RepID=A0A1J4JZ09_9EUKA|nr:hypothetical protein TRFO_30033 [Tritrichomonas foetus]|eukprot:OHT02772.1 hypothetical protein TRFO_30033 [Tritrichomonas foetus]